MAAPTGNQNAKGNKGGGRPSAQDEEQKALVINKSWQIINEIFEGKRQPQKTTQEEVALEIAKRTVPKEIKGDLGLNGTLTIQWQNEESQSPTPLENWQEDSTNQTNDGGF